MRPCLAAPFIALVLIAVSGCDLVSDPEGPRPEDFEVQVETEEVQTTEAAAETAQPEVRQDVAAPLSTARGGVTFAFGAPR